MGGLRERILHISRRFPDCFLSDEVEVRGSGCEARASLAEEEYKRYLILQRAKRKTRSITTWKRLASRTEDEDYERKPKSKSCPEVYKQCHAPEQVSNQEVVEVVDLTM